MSDAQWTAYRLTLKLLTPMHIGWRKVGNLHQTRFYVPARTIWGALTARLARETEAKDYAEIGRQVNDNLRFSYFYFIDQPEAELNCCYSTGGWPWSVNGQDKANASLFEWKYLNSYAGSPITERQVAEEGGLHETEHIMPFTREGKQVYLTGWVFERKQLDESIANWKEAIIRIQLGSERSYGWGRVAPPDKDVLKNMLIETKKMFGANLELDNDNPEVVLPKDAFITSHVDANELIPDDFEGRMEMLAGRLTTDAARYGRNFTPLTPCWTPGTGVKKEKRFAIGYNGIWCICEGYN